MSWLKKKTRLLRGIKIKEVRGTNETLLFELNISIPITLNNDRSLVIEPIIENDEIPFWE